MPQYIEDVFIFDNTRRNIYENAMRALREGKNVLIVGKPGTGKTALMFMILRGLRQQGYGIGYVVEGTTIVGREHEREGTIIFYDDLPRMNPQALRSIVANGVRLFIGTARKEELGDLKRKMEIDPKKVFAIFELPGLPDQAIRELVYLYCKKEGIQIESEEAVDIIVKKAAGIPMYVWHIVRELRILRMNLTRDFVDTSPAGLLDYIDDIFWRIMDEHEDRHALLLALRCMVDLARYAIHRDVFLVLFRIAKSTLENREIPLEKAFLSPLIDKVSRYLIQEKEYYTFRLPHDTWADVLRGMSSGLMSSEISKINMMFPFERRRRLLLSAINETWQMLREQEDYYRIRTLRDFLVFNGHLCDFSKLLGEIDQYLEGAPTIETVAKTTKEESAESFVPPQYEEIYELLRRAIVTNDTHTIGELEKKLSSSEDAFAKYLLGIISIYKGDYERAEKLLREAIDLGIDNPTVKYNLAVALYYQFKFDETLKILDEILTERPNDPEAMRLKEIIEKLVRGEAP